jgi:hypothetical protein
MHEGHLEAEHAQPRLDVDQLCTAPREVTQRSADVVHLVCNVVHPGASVREELPDRRVVSERREQLDAALADAHRRSLDALILDADAMLDAPAEETLVRANRLVEIDDRDADVMDAACFHAGDRM